MEKRTCFDMLSIHGNASLEEAKQAYKHLVKRWHPDQYGNDPKKQHLAQEKLKEINVAYRELIAILKNTTGSTAAFSKPETGKRPATGRYSLHPQKATFFDRVTSFFKTRLGGNGRNDNFVDQGRSPSSFGPRRSVQGINQKNRSAPDFSQILTRTLRSQSRSSGVSRKSAAGMIKPGRRRMRPARKRGVPCRFSAAPRRNSGDRIEKIKPVRPVGKIGE